MEGKRQFLVMALFLCSVILAAVTVSINTEKGMLGNVLTGNVVEFIEGFYYSQPLTIAEKTELLEPVEPELAPSIDLAQIVLLGDGRKELEIRGRNLQYAKIVLVDSNELSPDQYRVSESSQNVYLSIEEDFLQKEHTLLVITEYGESNTYILEQQRAFEEPIDISTPSLPPVLELPLAEDPQSRSIEQILMEYNIPLDRLVPAQLPFTKTRATYQTRTNVATNDEETSCQVTIVEWNTPTSNIGSTASFTVQGEGCDGKMVSFGVIERDYLSQDDVVPYQSEVFFQNGKATGIVTFEEASFGREVGGFEGNGEFSIYFGELNTQEGITGRVTATGPSVFSNTLIVSQSGTGSTSGDGPVLGSRTGEAYEQRAFAFKGCSDIYSIDEDCDGRYAVGTNTSLGSYYRTLDPDDTDPTVYDQETLEMRYGSLNDTLNLRAYLAAVGYNLLPTQNIFFVDPINGDDSTGQPNDLTKPYQTLNEIICEDQGTGQLFCQKSIASGSEKTREIQPGDAVLFRSGEYEFHQINLNDSRGYNLRGSQNQPILLKTYPGEKVTLKGLYLPGLEISNGPVSENLILDGFKIISTPGLGVYIGEGNQQNIKFKNLEVAPINKTSYARPGFEIHPRGDKRNLYFNGIVAHGLYYGGISLFTNGSLVNLTILNSKFYNNNGHVLTRGNITGSLIETSSFTNSGGYGILFIDGFQRSIIRNNLFFNGFSNELVSLSLPPSGFNVYSFNGNLITNNVFWRNNQTNLFCSNLIDCPPYPSPTNSSNIVFLHFENPASTDPYRAATNNAFTNNIFGTPSGESAIEFQSSFNWSLAAIDLATSIIINNLVYPSVTGIPNGGSYIVALCNMTDGTHDQSRPPGYGRDCPATQYYWTTTVPNVPPITNNTIANPSFLDVLTSYAIQPHLFDFRIAQNSPAKDYSFGPLAPLTDLQGNQRINNPDTGAYETLGNSVCSPQVETQLCAQQQGVCSGAVETCPQNGIWNGCTFYDYYAHNSSYELTETLCDGLDNDCDGVVDEGNICPPTQNFKFDITISPDSGDLTFGPSIGTNSIQVTLTKIGNGPNEQVSLTVGGLPIGATHEFVGPGQDAVCDFTSSNTCTVTLQISADEQVNSIPDQFDILITGTSPSHSNSTTYSLTLDKNPPELTLITPNTLTAGSTATLAIQGNNFDNTLELTESSTTIGTTTTASPNTAEFSYSVPSTPGDYNLAVTNQNGKSSSPFVVQVISQSIPLPQNLLPNWARETQAKTVQLTGASFSSTDTVHIGGVQVASNYIDQNNIEVTIPSTLTPGEYSLTVENTIGESQGNVPIYILEQGVPALNSVFPKRINNAYSQGVSFLGEEFSIYSGFQVNLGGNWITYPFTETLPMNETLLRAHFQAGYPMGTYQVRMIRHDFNVSNPVELEIYNQNMVGPIPDLDLDGIQDHLDQCRKTQLAYHSIINEYGCPRPAFNQLATTLSTNITNLSSLINVSNFKVGKRDEALIEFKENVTLLRQIPEFLMYHPLNIQGSLQIYNKTIQLNATALFELNLPSRLTFFNTSITNPVPRRDGSICTGQCTPVSFVQSTRDFTFDITGFSTYTVSQGTCGDGYCSITETQGSCRTDCGGGGSGGGSGGGGGGSGGGGGGSGGGSGSGTRIEKINLDTTKSGQTAIIKGTNIDLTYETNVYRIEVTDIQNGTVTLNFKNTTRILVAQNLELYSVNLDAEPKEDVELYIARNGDSYSVTISKIEEQTQTGGQTPPTTNQPGGRGPVIEQPSTFKAPKAGYWTILIGTLLVIFILTFIDLKINGKPKTHVQTILQTKKPDRPYGKKEVTMTTLIQEKKPEPKKLDTTTVQQTPTPVYRYVTSRPRNAHMTEIQGQKRQIMPQTQTSITPPKKQTLQQTPPTTVQQTTQNIQQEDSTNPQTTQKSQQISPPPTQNLPKMVAKPGEAIPTKTVQVPQEVKEKILESSKEETEEFDPYA